MSKKTIKKSVVLPFAMPKTEATTSDASYNLTRPKPETYADRTWPPPRGTRRSMGKR